MQTTTPPTRRASRPTRKRFDKAAVPVPFTPGGTRLDSLTDLAALLCGTPMAAVALADGDVLRFRASRGICIEELPLDQTFCVHAMRNRAPLVVEDAAGDERFQELACVRPARGPRAYAGVPLSSVDGEVVGTLCVLDLERRHFPDWQIRGLESLARRVEVRLQSEVQDGEAGNGGKHPTALLRALGDADAAYDQLANEIDGIVWECDLERLECRHVSAGVERLLGYSPSQWLQAPQCWQWLLHEEDRDAVLTQVRRAAQDPAVHDLRFRARARQGDVVWLQGHVRRVEDSRIGSHLRIVTQNESATARANAALHSLATIDDLTGLPNRRGLDDALRAAFDDCARGGRRLALLVLDIDRLWMINDSSGHRAGDALIREVARRLVDNGNGEVIARYGSDEFAVVVPADAPFAEIEARAARLQSAVAHPVRLANEEISATCSVGISIFPDDGTTPEGLLGSAEAALRHARELGPGQRKMFSASMHEGVALRLRTEQELRIALERDELVVHFQPQFGVARGELVGAEALVRWQHPERGLLLPHQFIPVAEASGLIGALGDRVIALTCQQLGRWRARGCRMPRVAINVSSAQVCTSLLPVLAQALHRNRLDGSALELEITESVLLANLEEAAVTLQTIRNLGVRLTLDDFGTGYSSLTMLRRLPVQALKLDRQFIAGITDRTYSAEIARAVICMSHSLGLVVTAEGVEAQSELDLLREYGCDHFQGFLRAPALTGEQFAAQFCGGRQGDRQPEAR